MFAGKYRVVRVMGSGGMGIVVEAFHEVLHQRVAVKFAAPLACDDEAIARFLQEARAAATIQNEHVARVMDAGKLDNGMPYLVLEYLEGTDMAEVMRAGPMPVAQAIDYVLEAAECLAEAHARGIIHRDLKPSNLFLARRPDGTTTVKVLDFGISKRLRKQDQPSTPLTAAGDMLGTPGYMPPEQIRSPRFVDVRADVWALALVLYELLAGTRVFQAPSAGEVFAAVLETEVPPLRKVRPDIPEQLEATIARALQRSRDARHPDVGAFAKELAPYASARGRDSLASVLGVLRFEEGTRRRGDPAGAAESQARTQDHANAASVARERARPARSHVGLTAALLSASAVVAVGLWLGLRPAQRDVTPAFPSSDRTSNPGPRALDSAECTGRTQRGHNHCVVGAPGSISSCVGQRITATRQGAAKRKRSAR